MKVWTKVRLKDYNKDIDIISKSLTNYVYGYGPIQDIINKYIIYLCRRCVLPLLFSQFLQSEEYSVQTLVCFIN